MKSHCQRCGKKLPIAAIYQGGNVKLEVCDRCDQIMQQNAAPLSRQISATETISEPVERISK